MALEPKPLKDRRGGGTAMVQAHGGAIGNPPHRRSHAIARKAEIMSAQGISQEMIAFVCDISLTTLKEHYRDELDKGLQNSNNRVARAILESALGERGRCGTCRGSGNQRGTDDACEDCGGTGEGRDWVREPNTTAQIWWSKNRMGWTDRERIEHVGDKGGPILHEQRSSGDTIREKLEQIRKRRANDDQT